MIDHANFSDERQHAILKSHQEANPHLRMIPANSKIQEKKMEDEEEVDDDKDDDFEVDYTATSNAIMDALRKVKSNLTLSEDEKNEARDILGCKPYNFNIIMFILIGIVIGTLIKR